MKNEDITHQIIGCAYKVFNKLGFGFLESVYRKSMVIELKRNDLKAEQERPLKIFYDDEIVGEFYIDIFVENEIVVELKAVRHLAKEHEVQLVNYLNGLKKRDRAVDKLWSIRCTDKTQIQTPCQLRGMTNPFLYQRWIHIYPFLPERDKKILFIL